MASWLAAARARSDAVSIDRRKIAQMSATSIASWIAWCAPVLAGEHAGERGFVNDGNVQLSCSAGFTGKTVRVSRDQ